MREESKCRSSLYFLPDFLDIVESDFNEISLNDSNEYAFETKNNNLTRKSESRRSSFSDSKNKNSQILQKPIRRKNPLVKKWKMTYLNI